MSEILVQQSMTLRLEVQQSTTVLPRCLQILSRRGFVLTHLKTTETDTSAVLMLTVRGPVRWQQALPRLLSRLVDVNAVSVVAVEGAAHE